MEISQEDNDLSDGSAEILNLLNSAELSVKTKIMLLNSRPLSDQEHEKRYNQIQLSRARQLLDEYIIGRDLKDIIQRHKCRGKKASSGNNTGQDKMTTAEAIKQRYPRLGGRQIRDFKNLELKYIKEAILIALETGRELTRSLALSRSTRKRADNAKQTMPVNIRQWMPKKEDFAEEYQKLRLTEKMGATSLFANIGVGTCLLEANTPIRVTVANEKEPRRAKAHKRLYPDCEVIEGDIADSKVFAEVIKAHREKDNKIMYICCPCQDASSLNSAESKGKGERAILFKSALDVIEAVLPMYIVFENVARWLEGRPERALDILGDKTIGNYLVKNLECLGYNVTVGILSAADYETAENRERAIILACKKELGVWKFPKKHKFRPTVFEAIGNMKSLEAGEVDPNNKWHYGLPLAKHEIEFLAHTPTGCSAWNNAKIYQPRNKDGSPSGAQFDGSYKRIDPINPCNVIESSSGSIGDINSVHFGRPLSDGTYSDSRVLSIAEILRLIGTPDDFLEPLISPPKDDNDFNGLTWKEGRLIGADESFIRLVLGEHMCPKLLLNLMTTMPGAANDNAPPDDKS